MPALDRYTIGKDIFDSKDLRFWSSFAQGHPSSVKVESQDFATPSYLSFLYAEGQNSQHNSLFLECIETKKRIRLIDEQTNGSIVERTIQISGSECGPRSRLVFINDGSYYSGFSTPYKANIFHYLKYSTIACAFYFQISFLVFLLFFFLSYIFNKKMPPKFYVPWGTIVIFGVISYFLFFVFWISRDLGVFTCTAGLSLAAYKLVKSPQSKRFWRENFDWIKALYCFGTILTMILWLKDSGNFSWLPSTRFSPAEWSSDNLLPIFTMKAFLNGEQLKGLFGLWEITDRPPLFTGAVLVASPIWELFRQIGRGDIGLPVMFSYAQILNCIWIFPLFYWRRVFKISKKEYLVLLSVLFSTSFILFNSIYTWPKLLTVFLTFPSILLVIKIFLKKELESRFLSWSLVGCILALQTHGGVIFYLFSVAILLMLNPLSLWRKKTPLIFALIATVVLWTPWILFEKLVIPSSGPLVKLAFAGTFGWDTKLSTLEIISDRYRNLTFQSWLDMKMLGLENWLGYFQEINYQNLYENNSLFGIIRKIQQTSLIPSLLPYLAMAAFAYKKINRNIIKDQNILPLVYLGIAGHLINLGITWSHHVNGHNSYPSIFCLFLACALLITKIRNKAIIAMFSLIFSIPWTIDTLLVPTQLPVVSQIVILLFATVIFHDIYSDRKNQSYSAGGK